MGYINESVIYNIYPLGFCGAPKENDFKQEYRLDKIYGWIDHMKSMSVNALVFNPVFESSKHGYDTIDYKKMKYLPQEKARISFPRRHPISSFMYGRLPI